MAQGFPHTRFNSSSLVRTLADLAVADVPAPKQSFADRLGQWLDFTDALTLFAVINGGKAVAPDVRSAAPVTGDSAARQAFDRVRDALVESITGDGGPRPGKARIELPAPGPEATVESAADFAPYHRYYLAHQRDMAASIGSLRTTVRAALSERSAALGRLAALDAAMDQALAGRERDLLATVPGLLGGRFEHLYWAHQVKLAEAQVADEPDRWLQPGGWLAGFCREMQSVLLAELDMRLQPIAGMIAALASETTGKQ